jgi:hypothetical protein
MEDVNVPGAGGGKSAQELVSLPAILLMVLGGLTILSALWGLVSSIGGGNAAQMAQFNEMLNNPDLPPQFKSAMSSYMNFATRSGPFMSLFQLVLGGLMGFGGLKMKNLQSFPLAIAASIIAIVPCFNCCYCLGIPLGIWSLIVLNKAEVKTAFRP